MCVYTILGGFCGDIMEQLLTHLDPGTDLRDFVIILTATSIYSLFAWIDDGELPSLISEN